MAQQSISVRHNIEVAHRLFESLGKCEAIHGHSMWVTLTVWGPVDDTGKLAGLDYGSVKRLLRGYLDTTYDHHLLLNQKDPWRLASAGEFPSTRLPGLQEMPGDPTTENIARWIGEWVSTTLPPFTNAPLTKYWVEVKETSVNFASWTFEP